MLRPTNRLTDSKIKAGLRRAPEIGKLMLNDGNGLYLQIHNKVPSWLHRYQIDNKTRAMGLGRFPEVSLVRARELADDNRRLKRRGVDPLIQRQTEAQAELVAAAKQVPTFEACAALCFTKLAREWKNPKSAAQWTQSLRDYVLPKIGKLPIDAIDSGLVLEVLAPVWEKHIVTAERIRGRIKRVFDYAKAKKYRDDNPAEWLGGLEHDLSAPKKVHEVKDFDALPYAQIAEFMAKLRAYQPADAATSREIKHNSAAFQLLLLTASRSATVLLARKDEIDLDTKSWTRPPAHMKMRKTPHTVPLSESAMVVVEGALARNPESPLLFPGETPNRPMAPGTFRRLMARLGYAGFDPHGFRACYRTWVQESTNFDPIAAELQLGHNVGSKVEKAYARGDMFAKRRVLDAAWEAQCNGTFDQPAWAAYHAQGYGVHGSGQVLPFLAKQAC